MTPYCECGCGGIPSHGKGFIRGHNLRVNHPMKNPVIARKHGDIMRGRTKETHEYLRIAGEKRQGRTKDNYEGIRRGAEKNKGRIPWNKGKTKDTDDRLRYTGKKISKGLSGRTKEEYEYLQRHSEAITGRTKENHSGVRRQSEKISGRTKENNSGVRQMAETLTGRTQEEYEYIRIAAEKKTGRTKENHEGIRRGAEKRCGRTKETDESVRKMAEKARLRWQDPKYVGKMMKALGRTPNKSEKFIESILNQLLPDEYKINVNGNVMTLGGKRPDFVNINGQKKVIEYNGDHWHTEEESKERAALFKSLGFDTLFIWGREMGDIQAVINKILEFNDGHVAFLEKREEKR